MGDYFRAEQVAAKLGLILEELEEAEAHGLVRPIRKQGAAFYSSQQVYRLRAACRLRQKKGWGWEQVAAELSKKPMFQVTTV